MGVKYVLSEPAKPGWWVRNKAFACLAIGLTGGFWLAGGCDDASPHGTPTPSPSPSVSSSDR